MYEAVMVYIKSMTFLIKYKKLTGFEKSKKKPLRRCTERVPYNKLFI